MSSDLLDRPDDVLLRIDRAASTVEMAGRRFPAVALICPPAPGNEDESEFQRSLGTGTDNGIYIPAENGVLFDVQEGRNERHHGLSLGLYTRICELVYETDGSLWLPMSVGLRGGSLFTRVGFNPAFQTAWYWAEPDWVVETIDRLSAKPLMQPEGPSARFIRLDHEFV